MKRNIAVVLIIISLVGLALPLIGCGSGQGEVVAQASQTATAQRGDLTIDISAAGNLSLADTADLAFEVAGTVEEVKVQEGDSVKKSDLLAKLDSSERDDQLATLEKQIRTQERAVNTAQRNLEAKKSAIPDRQRDVLQAQINEKNAEIALEKAKDTYEWPDIEVAQNAVTRAQSYLQYAIDNSNAAGAGTADIWQAAVDNAESQLKAAEATLDAMLTGADPEEIKIKETEIEIAQGKLTVAENTVKDAERDIEDATVALADAHSDLADAQKDLDKEKATNLEVIAPFDGFVTTVNVEGGDEVMKGTVAVQIADPNKFEAYISVSEMDIKQVKLGGDAEVQVDSLSGLILPAKVAHIAPTATIQSGVVNYKVRVEVQSLEAVAQAASGQTSATEDLQLREGLTVTLSIVVQQKTGVLLIPNAAITRQGGQSYVDVVTSTGATEKRAIKTGMTDYTNTEVTEGLTEGEKVSIPKSTKTTTTTQQQPGGIMMPGVGGGGPPPGG